MLLKIYIVLVGLVLVCLGVLGFFAGFAESFETAVFGSYWYSDNNQNLFHVVLGFFTFFIGVAAAPTLQKVLTWLFSLSSMGLAVYSLYSDDLVSAFGLEKPGDTAFYLVLGTVGLLVLTGTIIRDRKRQLGEMEEKLAL